MDIVIDLRLEINGAPSVPRGSKPLNHRITIASLSLPGLEFIILTRNKTILKGKRSKYLIYTTSLRPPSLGRILKTTCVTEITAHGKHNIVL
jgi:hypothetical protein